MLKESLPSIRSARGNRCEGRLSNLSEQEGKPLSLVLLSRGDSASPTKGEPFPRMGNAAY